MVAPGRGSAAHRGRRGERSPGWGRCPRRLAATVAAGSEEASGWSPRPGQGRGEAVPGSRRRVRRPSRAPRRQARSLRSGAGSLSAASSRFFFRPRPNRDGSSRFGSPPRFSESSGMVRIVPRMDASHAAFRTPVSAVAVGPTRDMQLSREWPVGRASAPCVTFACAWKAAVVRRPPGPGKPTAGPARGGSGSPVFPSVGLTGFEPAASSSRTRRATKLRHSPKARRVY